MKIDPFNKQVAVFLADLKSPKARSQRLAQVAKEGIADIRARNRAAIGSDPTPQIFVDGREGAPLDSVRPEGVIVANFNPLLAALEWIGEQLLLVSPRLTGKYQRSHVLEIDGAPWDGIGPMPTGERFVFFNTTPYARKIEPKERIVHRRALYGDRRRFHKDVYHDFGQSDQAPDGVYAAIAVTADMRFSNIARIRYSINNFRQETGLSHPAIIVRPY